MFLYLAKIDQKQKCGNYMRLWLWKLRHFTVNEIIAEKTIFCSDNIHLWQNIRSHV